MNFNIYSSVLTRKFVKPKSRISESTYTRALQKFIYHGVGPKFLGFSSDRYEVLPDGGTRLIESGRPRSWNTPTAEFYKWSPLLHHLQGAFRGLVADNSSHVPFVSVDVDRHSADVLANQHMQDVMLGGRILKQHFSFCCGIRLHWMVEINPRNGSVKFFGWSFPYSIPINTAKEIGNSILNYLSELDDFRIKKPLEVFPANHRQVLLPFRKDKITVVSTGQLGKCQRKMKDRSTGKMVPYETYSMLELVQWLESGEHFCEKTLATTLLRACSNLQDDPTSPKFVMQNRKNNATENHRNNSEDDSRINSSERDILNPNSFERQLNALLDHCRRMRRVVTPEEALQHIQDEGLFTGYWGQHYSRRRSRVEWILDHIAKTFDPTKCRGVRHEINIGKFDKWAKAHVGSGFKKDRRLVNEFGEITEQAGRYNLDWQFVSAFLSIVEYCLLISPNHDHSLPQARAEDLWDRCYQGKLISIPFCEKKWKLCRDYLESKQIIQIIDSNWRRGKAMRWRVTETFSCLIKWWRKPKTSSPFEAVPLPSFLQGEYYTTHTTLNAYPSFGLEDTVFEWSDPSRAPP